MSGHGWSTTSQASAAWCLSCDAKWQQTGDTWALAPAAEHSRETGHAVVGRLVTEYSYVPPEAGT